MGLRSDGEAVIGLFAAARLRGGNVPVYECVSGAAAASARAGLAKLYQLACVVTLARVFVPAFTA